MSEAEVAPLPDADVDVGRRAGLKGYLQGSDKRSIAVKLAQGTRTMARELKCEDGVLPKAVSNNLQRLESLKREDGVLPKAVSDRLQRLESSGDETIERMVVVRTPVQAFVGKLMQTVTLGKYKEVISQSSYDQMFHLALLINGQFVLEKNEVITLTDAGGPKEAIAKGSDVMAVKIPSKENSRLTFRILLDRTKEKMGSSDFSNYDAKTNNCQDFILAVLESNGLAPPHLVSFVKQDSEGIFDQLPSHTRRVAKALTDVAAVGDKLVEDIVKSPEELKISIGEGAKTVLGKAVSFGSSKIKRIGSTKESTEQ